VDVVEGGFFRLMTLWIGTHVIQVLREMFFRAPSLGSKGLNRGIVTGKTPKTYRP
jgi:hypothetical protein